MHKYSPELEALPQGDSDQEQEPARLTEPVPHESKLLNGWKISYRTETPESTNDEDVLRILESKREVLANVIQGKKGFRHIAKDIVVQRAEASAKRQLVLQRAQRQSDAAARKARGAADA